jgi:hypothetical protein
MQRAEHVFLYRKKMRLIDQERIASTYVSFDSSSL